MLGTIFEKSGLNRTCGAQVLELQAYELPGLKGTRWTHNRRRAVLALVLRARLAVLLERSKCSLNVASAPVLSLMERIRRLPQRRTQTHGDRDRREMEKADEAGKGGEVRRGAEGERN